MQYIRWMSVADRYTKMYLDRHLAPLGLNSSQFMFVIRVCQNPGMTQDQFLASFNVHPSNITRALASLEKAGLLRREQNEKDKRTWQLYPTEQAKQIYPQVISLCEEWQASLLEAIPPEAAAQFEENLKRMALWAVERLEQETEAETETEEE